MQETTKVTVRSIAFLDAYCKEHGLASTQSVDVPQAGMTAQALAESIGLPIERIEGIFHNCKPSGLDAVIKPGDTVAFVPYGTPASHTAFFGPLVTR
jgi:hypothetical protein